jgi:hypothetical protein
LLKGSDTTTSVTVPFESRVVDGILEVRLIAEAGQAFDAQYVQVASHRSTGDYAGLGSYRAPQPPLGRAYDPLNYGPRPPMMYGLPNLYPNLYGAGQATSQDPIFWRQLWLQQFPHSLYLYPYQYFPGRSFERHHHHKPHK